MNVTRVSWNEDGVPSADTERMALEASAHAVSAEPTVFHIDSLESG